MILNDGYDLLNMQLWVNKGFDSVEKGQGSGCTESIQWQDFVMPFKEGRKEGNKEEKRGRERVGEGWKGLKSTVKGREIGRELKRQRTEKAGEKSKKEW